MHVTVTPRVVCPPWYENRCRAGRRVIVGREAEVLPDPGVVAELQQHFPHRYVQWAADRQRWTMRQRNPLTGHDEEIEELFLLDTPPASEDAELQQTAETMAEFERAALVDDLIRRRDGSLVQLYQPFDYEFVRRRVRQARDLSYRGVKRYNDFIREKNAAISRAKLKATAAEWQAWMREDRRWLGVLAAALAGTRPDVALTEKQPLGRGAAFSPSQPEETPCHSSAAS